MGKGSLPENLPPVFTSESLTDVFDPSDGGRYRVTQSRRGKLAGFNASKRGQQRRLFAVPHPLFQHDAAIFFEKNWDVLSKVYDNSTGSASKPQFPVDGFRAVDIISQGKLPTIRLQTLARKRFCLITDVSRCFPSIYTHAIPWALDGRTAAKADHRENSSNVRGNRLDFIVRQSQDGQTAGIPVGPDTSRLISELILSRIDADHLQGGKKQVYYVRHVDDYWIGGDSYDECETILSRLRTGLGEYQLDINESKTRIVPLSQAIGEAWPSELKREIKQSFDGIRSRRPRAEDITALLAQVIDRSVTSQDDGIIKYAIRQIDRTRAWSDRWDVLEPFLAHAAIQFPHCFDYVARVIAWRARIGHSFDEALWGDVTATVAGRAASLGHDSELVWALWLMKELNFKVTTRQVDQFTRVSGPLVLALLAHMAVQGRTTRAKFISDLEERAVADDQFTNEMWPLTLELHHLGHHRRLDAHRRVGNDVVAAWHSAKKSIVNWNRMPRVFDHEEAEGEHKDDWEPEFAIEDFASAYDGDDEDEDADTEAWSPPDFERETPF